MSVWVCGCERESKFILMALDETEHFFFMLQQMTFSFRG